MICCLLSWLLYYLGDAASKITLWWDKHTYQNLMSASLRMQMRAGDRGPWKKPEEHVG